jgi:2',3'-cyclic-nucleotide 2'-phosphodiesterase (5'-nucleotidase family)
MSRYMLPFALAGMVLAFAGCSKETPSGGMSAKLTIVYTGNVGGLIEPCGCRLPLGGVARRSTEIADLKSENPNAILVDSGALLYDNVKLSSPFEPALRIRAAIEVEELRKERIDAANVANMDLSNSADSLLAYGRAGLPWLSANIVWKKTGALVFPADTVKTANGVRVAIFGLTDDNTVGVPMFDDSSPLRVNDPVETARGEVEKLKKSADLIVMLAYMDPDRVEKLVAAIPGISVAVVSHTRLHNPGSDHSAFKPVKSGKTIIIRCPDGGRVIGKLDLVIVNGSADFADSREIRDLRPVELREKSPLAATSTFTNTFIDLDASIADDESLKVKVDQAVKILEEIQKNYSMKH